MNGHKRLGVTERYAVDDSQYLKEAVAAIEAFWTPVGDSRMRKTGAGRGNRTPDLRFTKPLLYR